MRQLNRDPAPPACLLKYHAGQDRWNQVTAPEKAEIWIKLDAMQGGRCAYCEADLGRGKHVEHFRQQGRHPQGTFKWENLFGSCNRLDSCGKHKDQCGRYHPPDLIKPDVDDPEHFLVFAAMGTVHVRQNLSAAEQHRASETIRILNLNSAALKQTRRTLLMHYLESAEAFAEMAIESGVAAVLPLLAEELGNISALPFTTAIKHILTNQSRP